MNYTKLGKSHKEWRISNGLTLRSLAKLLRVDPGRLSAFERGRMDEHGNVQPLTDDELMDKLPPYISARLTSEQLRLLAETVRRSFL